MTKTLPLFAHLHTHTEYSFDAFSRIEPLVEQAKAYGMPALAITDHGAMHGVWPFYHACKQASIHPVIGLEAYLAPDLADRSQKYDYHHLLLLAENTTGYHNLMCLTTIAHTQGYHYRPRIDKHTLARHSEGLIVTSGCLSAEVPRLLLKADEAGARKVLHWYQEVFGEDHVFLELQEHHGVQNGQPSPQGKLNHLLYQLHQETRIPLVATNDVHYINSSDAYLRDILTCIRENKTLAGKGYLQMDSNEYHLRTPEEMWRLFGDVPSALTNTIEIARRCQVTLEPGVAHLPNFPLPAPFATPASYLTHLCEQGAKARFGVVSETVRRRLAYELEVIEHKGFATYFLIVWEAVSWAKGQGIGCSARGSAAGSMVAYVLGITNIDPFFYSLPFERFLNPLRMQMPDIDIDIVDEKRHLLISHLVEIYGELHVAQIVTFTRLLAKNALKDVARVMGQPALGERLSSLLPSGQALSLSEAIEDSQALQALQEGEASEIIAVARSLEGSIRGPGKHAAGIVVAREPLETLVPLSLGSSAQEETIRITQYMQPVLEELGLLKMDFLGSSNLMILQRTLLTIKETRGKELALEQIPLDDPATFQLFGQGHVTSIFQFENPQLAGFLRQLRPSSIFDLIALAALFRPGPIKYIRDFIDAKHGRKKVVYLDPRMQQWLAESYGVLVYQDQVLATVINLAGFDWGEADGFRKAISKKKADQLASYREKFIAGCLAHDVSLEVAQRIYEQILPFAGYGFNKAHAASYAVMAYYTGYLKVHYPAEFLAATLTAEVADAAKIANNIAECQRIGVPVFPPDVQVSRREFTAEARGVRFGLLAIKGIGEEPIKEIIRARTAGGRFKDLADFCTRVDPKIVGKSHIELLIKAGAMDGLGGGTRSQLLDAVDRARSWAARQRLADASGQESLFAELEGSEEALAFALDPRVEEIEASYLMEWEKDLLGVNMKRESLTSFRTLLDDRVKQTVAQVSPALKKKGIVLGGVLTEVRRIVTKHGEPMCQATLQDLTGTIGITVFPAVYKATQPLWKEQQMLLVHGVVDVYQGKARIICEQAERIEETKERQHTCCTLRITIPVTGSDQQAVDRDMGRVQELYQLLQTFPGSDHYELIVNGDDWQTVLTPENDTVEYSRALHQQLEALLGEGTVEVSTKSHVV